MNPPYSEGQLLESIAGLLVPPQKTVTFSNTDGKGALGAAAVLTTLLTGANNDLDFTAVATDDTGNAVTVTYINPGASGASLLVRVNGNDIAVWLATQSTSVAATNTITDGNATNFSDGDTVVIGPTTYRFKTVMVQIGDVQIGASADASLLSLAKTINGTGVAGTDMFTGTPADPTVSSTATVTAHVITLTVLVAGAAGNSVTLVVSAHGTAGGATFSGGKNAGQITSTSGAIITAIAAETSAAALVVATNHSGNDGSGVVTAMTKSSLTGGTTGTVQLFKVKGSVLASLRAYCTSSLTGTSATLVHGNTFSTNRLITILTATSITVRKGIDSTGIVTDGTALAKTPLKIFLDSETIFATPATAAVTGGTLQYICDFVPLTPGAYVTAV